MLRVTLSMKTGEEINFKCKDISILGSLIEFTCPQTTLLKKENGNLAYVRKMDVSFLGIEFIDEEES